ncbi:MAG: hypothetical protein ED859_05955 [Desulfuromonadales bacterium]|nr:MAG: hypothetical protein ED859_05955 [Desulfuromonadales bacterium]
MQRHTVRLGIYSIIVAVVVITAATVLRGVLAQIFSIQPSVEERLVHDGLFSGGIVGSLGVMITTVGLLRGSAGSIYVDKRLAPRLIILGALTFVFAVLLFSSFIHQESTPLRPSETITI